MSQSSRKLTLKELHDRMNGAIEMVEEGDSLPSYIADKLRGIRDDLLTLSESTATDEGYPGIAHDLETLRSALGAMCEEFRGLDLPYGSKAYTQATTALNATRRPLWKQP